MAKAVLALFLLITLACLVPETTPRRRWFRGRSIWNGIKTGFRHAVSLGLPKLLGLLGDRPGEKSTFDQYDLDNDGHLSRDEYRQFVKDKKLPERDAMRHFDFLDQNDDDKIHDSELNSPLVKAFLKAEQEAEDDLVQELQNMTEED